MFHYRLKPLNNLPRIVIGAFVAIVLHIVLMNFEPTLKPVIVPNISLPRSVSVFLKQTNFVERPELLTEKSQREQHLVEEQPAAERVLEKPVLQKITVKEIKEKSDQQPLLSEKTSRVPAVEKITPVRQDAGVIEKKISASQDRAAETKDYVPQAEAQAALENTGVALPGTLQMAYPRYQLNLPPTYPGLARKRGQEGTVILQVLVSKEGGVDDLRIETSSGFRLLDRAAVIAVQQWLFEPGQRDDKRVEMWVKVPVTFKLK
jgi:protein TonB